MASGPLPASSPMPGFKFFFYGAEHEDLLGDAGAIYLVQMVISNTVSYTSFLYLLLYYIYMYICRVTEVK